MKQKTKRRNRKDETTPQDVMAPTVEEEHRSMGRIAPSVFRRYFGFGGVVLLCTITALFIMQVAAAVCANVFLSSWTNSITADEPHGEFASYGAYLGSVLVQIAVTFVTTNVVMAFGGTAAYRLHQHVVKTLLGAKLAFFDATSVGRINFFSRDVRVIDV